MNIKDMNELEKSAMLVRAMDEEPIGYNLYHPRYMILAWHCLRWAINKMHTDGPFGDLEYWLQDNPLENLALLENPQAVWLDGILTLIIEYG